MLGLGILREFAAFAREVGALAVGLRADGDVLARSHGHGAPDEAGDAGGQHGATAGAGRRDADHEARGRDDSVIRAEDGGAQPAGLARAVRLPHFWLKAYLPGPISATAIAEKKNRYCNSSASPPDCGLITNSSAPCARPKANSMFTAISHAPMRA